MSIYDLGDAAEYTFRHRHLYHDSGISVAKYHRTATLSHGAPALTLYIAAEFSIEDKKRVALLLIERAEHDKTIRSAHVECACGTCIELAIAPSGGRALCLLCKGAQCEPHGRCRRPARFGKEKAA